MSNFIDDKEYEEALQEAEAVAGEELYCQTVKFRQAREWEGQTYDSLTFDWGKLAYSPETSATLAGATVPGDIFFGTTIITCLSACCFCSTSTVSQYCSSTRKSM